MKNLIRLVFLAVVLLISLTSCGTASTPVPSTESPVPAVPPTFTLVPATATDAPTATVIPSPTPWPGEVVIPVESLKSEIPWLLPLEGDERVGVSYLTFNTMKPPFDNPVVRQAFVAATDRSVIIEIVNKYLPEQNPREATTLTPPEVLGLNLSGYVGIPFDPQRAKELLASAGYSNPGDFPPVNLFMKTESSELPGIPIKLAKAIADSWRNNLGIEVTVSITPEENIDRLSSSNPPDVFRTSFAANYNDPENFFRDIFLPTGIYYGVLNTGQFSNKEFEKIVEQAHQETDPAVRQMLYIQAEQILLEQEAAVIPLYYATYNRHNIPSPR